MYGPGADRLAAADGSISEALLSDGKDTPALPHVLPGVQDPGLDPSGVEPSVGPPAQVFDEVPHRPIETRLFQMESFIGAAWGDIAHCMAPLTVERYNPGWE
jgi:hypothetical protein